MSPLPLTQIDDGGFSKQLRKTRPGQASLAGEGPKGATCRGCAHWMGGDYYAKSNVTHGPTLKPAPCSEYKRFAGRKGPNVPHNASACKYFYAKETPLPIENPKDR